MLLREREREREKDDKFVWSEEAGLILEDIKLREEESDGLKVNPACS